MQFMKHLMVNERVTWWPKFCSLNILTSKQSIQVKYDNRRSSGEWILKTNTNVLFIYFNLIKAKVLHLTIDRRLEGIGVFITMKFMFLLIYFADFIWTLSSRFTVEKVAWKRNCYDDNDFIFLFCQIWSKDFQLNNLF